MVSEGSAETISWLFICKLICLHKGKIKSTYKEEHKLVLISVLPVAIRQSEKFSDLSDLLSVLEFPTKDNELLPANEALPAMEIPLPKYREKRRSGRSLASVETHKELRNYLIRILVPDYEVVSVCNAEAAPATICKQHPDAVLVSSALVGTSGEELAVRIKSGDRVAHVPVVLLVKPGGDSREAQRNAGLYVTTPFAISSLKAEIESLVTNREIIREGYIRLTLGVDTPNDIEADVPLSDSDQEFISLVRSLTEKRLTDSRFTIDELSDCVNVSRSSFYDKIKEITDHALVDYARSVRLNRTLILLVSRKYTVTEVADMTGFSDPKCFRIMFKKRFGDLPIKYINNL